MDGMGYLSPPPYNWNIQKWNISFRPPPPTPSPPNGGLTGASDFSVTNPTPPMGARCSAAANLGEAGPPSSGPTAAAGCPRNPGGGPATHGGEERLVVVEVFVSQGERGWFRCREVCVCVCFFFVGGGGGFLKTNNLEEWYFCFIIWGKVFFGGGVENSLTWFTWKWHQWE